MVHTKTSRSHFSRSSSVSSDVPHESTTAVFSLALESGENAAVEGKGECVLVEW